MQQAHKQFGTQVWSLKGTSTGAGVGKDPVLLKGCSTLAPLLSYPKCWQYKCKTGFEVCSAEGAPCTVHRASFNCVTHKASRDLLLSESLILPLSPSLNLWQCFDDASVGRETRWNHDGWQWVKKKQVNKWSKKKKAWELHFNDTVLFCFLVLSREH